MSQQAKARFMNMSKEAFAKTEDTRIYWICNGGILINSRGTCILIDPLLDGFDMPLLTECPLNIDDITHVDATLITHCDNDHFSRITNKKIADRCDCFHTTHYVATLFEEEEIYATGHNIYDYFLINDIKITLSPADHAWQNEREKYAVIRTYKKEDFCGFWIETQDGVLWMPGDSRLLPEQLTYSEPDVILLDISNSKWHLGHDNLPILVNTYPSAILIPIHWGCVASTMPEFNGNPNDLITKIEHPKRVKNLALGEPFLMKRNHEK